MKKKVTISDIIKGLASRKFLLALGAFITFIANGQYAEALTVALGYLGIEGAADFKSR